MSDNTNAYVSYLSSQLTQQQRDKLSKLPKDIINSKHEFFKSPEFRYRYGFVDTSMRMSDLNLIKSEFHGKYYDNCYYEPTPLLNKMFKPANELKKEWVDIIKPYQSSSQFVRDMLQPWHGIVNVSKGAFGLLVNPFKSLTQNNLDSRFQGLKLLQVSGYHFVRDSLKLLRGISQLVTTPLTYFIKIPFRLAIVTPWTKFSQTYGSSALISDRPLFAKMEEHTAVENVTNQSSTRMMSFFGRDQQPVTSNSTRQKELSSGNSDQTHPEKREIFYVVGNCYVNINSFKCKGAKRHKIPFSEIRSEGMFKKEFVMLFKSLEDAEHFARFMHVDDYPALKTPPVYQVSYPKFRNEDISRGCIRLDGHSKLSFCYGHKNLLKVLNAKPISDKQDLIYDVDMEKQKFVLRSR